MTQNAGLRRRGSRTAPPPYPPYEERHQEEVRARQRVQSFGDWAASLDDMVFERELMNGVIPFSGDHRPPAGATGHSLWEDLQALVALREQRLAFPSSLPRRTSRKRSGAPS